MNDERPLLQRVKDRFRPMQARSRAKVDSVMNSSVHSMEVTRDEETGVVAFPSSSAQIALRSKTDVKLRSTKPVGIVSK